MEVTVYFAGAPLALVELVEAVALPVLQAVAAVWCYLILGP
jgi:hypothetical protein